MRQTMACATARESLTCAWDKRVSLQTNSFECETPVVWQSMVRRKLQAHTKARSRYVVVPDSVRSMMLENPARFESGLVFKTPEGHMFRDADWLMDKWNRAHKATSVRRRLGLYPWRHTFISLALQSGMNINDVAILAGNSRSVIEKHYEKWIPRDGDIDRLKREIEKAQR